MSREDRVRRMFTLALTATLVGIGLSVSGLAALGSWVTVGGLFSLMAAVHRLGRLGPDPPQREGSPRAGR